jgi:hypothetical protein
VEQEKRRATGWLVLIESEGGNSPRRNQEGNAWQDWRGAREIDVCRRSASNVARAPRGLMVVVTGNMFSDGNCGEQIDVGVSGEAVNEERRHAHQQQRRGSDPKALAPGSHRPDAMHRRSLVSSDGAQSPWHGPLP